MKDKLPVMARAVNGWQISTDTVGVYGNSYLKRAMVALVGLGANQPADAVYPLASGDADGRALDGAHAYVLHFDKQDLPPVDAFWSVTVYDNDGFPVANSLDRFTLGDRDELKYNPEGSLDLYIQHASPGADKESNWLPAPSGSFNLTMRCYAPKAQVLDGRWNPPPVRRSREGDRTSAASAPVPEGNKQAGKPASASTGKMAHYEIQGIGQWKNLSSSSSLTTAPYGTLRTSDILGVGKMQAGPLFRFIWTPEFRFLGAESKFWVEYGQIIRTRTRTISDSFTFLGNLYVVDSTLSAQLKTRQFELAYAPRWGNSKFKIGPAIWYERLGINLALSDVNAGKSPISRNLNFPNDVALLGADFDYAPDQRFDLYGHAGVVPCCGGGQHIFESEFGAKYSFAHGLGVLGGLRYSYAKQDFSASVSVVGGETVGPFSGFLKFPEWGPFVGLSWRF